MTTICHFYKYFVENKIDDCGFETGDAAHYARSWEYLDIMRDSAVVV